MVVLRGLLVEPVPGCSPLPHATAQLLRAIQKGGLSKRAPISIEWSVQPSDAFEHQNLEQISKCYDLFLIDDTHLGDAVSSGCIQPIEGFFDAKGLQSLSRAAICHAYDLFTAKQRLWALPVDISCHVMAFRPDLVEKLPAHWDDLEPDGPDCRQSLPLAGYHALNSFLAMCVGHGEEPGGEDLYALINGLNAILRMHDATPFKLNRYEPHDILKHMQRHDDLHVVPLIAGSPAFSLKNAIDGAAEQTPIGFVDPPQIEDGEWYPNVLMAKGLALSARCKHKERLAILFRWIASHKCQKHFWPKYGGAPIHRDIWMDDEANKMVNGYYRNTFLSTDTAWHRPNFPGYRNFAKTASMAIRGCLRGGLPARNALWIIRNAWREHHPDFDADTSPLDVQPFVMPSETGTRPITEATR